MDYLDCFFSTEACKIKLAHILSLFIVEAKKQDGNFYFHLLGGILCYICEKDQYTTNFLNQKIAHS